MQACSEIFSSLSLHNAAKLISMLFDVFKQFILIFGWSHLKPNQKGFRKNSFDFLKIFATSLTYFIWIITFIHRGHNAKYSFCSILHAKTINTRHSLILEKDYSFSSDKIDTSYWSVCCKLITLMPNDLNQIKISKVFFNFLMIFCVKTYWKWCWKHFTLCFWVIKF